jgi:hypothetical protein
VRKRTQLPGDRAAGGQTRQLRPRLGVVAAIERPAAKRGHLDAALFGHAADLGLRQVLDPEGLHQPLDPPGRQART